MGKDRPIIMAHCNTCGHETKHQVLGEEEKRGTDKFVLVTSSQPSGIEDSEAHDWAEVYEMLKCCGCDSVIFRIRRQGYDCPEGSAEYFPPAISRQMPRWRRQLMFKTNIHVYGLLCEVYSALHSGNCRLAMMGARALIDMVLVEKVGDSGPFSKKLRQFEELGYVSKTEREYLTSALEAGHAASHRGHWSSATDVNKVMDIIENMLQSVYVLEDAARELRDSTPPRENS